MPQTAESRTRGIKRVLWQILFLNVVVSAAKAAWGLISGSTAMFADGIHSLTDASSNVVALVAMSAASKPIDESHPYGHQKYESFASAIIGVMLLLAAWRVGSESVNRLVAYAKDGTLYVLQYASSPFALGGPGQIVRVAVDGTRSILETGAALQQPAGLAIGKDGALYVSNKTVTPGGGEVLRILP